MPELMPPVLLYAEDKMKTTLNTTFEIPEANRRMGEALEEYVGRGGKHIRPAMVFSTIQTYGTTDIVNGLWAAMSIHLDHNHFLIHDDQEDVSYFRRGRQTLHIMYGEDFAINYGDYLRCLASEAMDNGANVWDSETFKRMTLARHKMLKTTCEGQDLEFQLRSSPLREMTADKVFKILEKKSAYYTIWTGYRYGSILSGLPDEEIDSLENSFLNVGIAFQLQDDILDVIAEKKEETGEATLAKQKFGKDWAGDVEEGKRTDLIRRLYERASVPDLRYINQKLDIGGDMRKLVRRRYEMMKRGISPNDSEYVEVVNKIDEIKTRIVEMYRFYRVIEDSQDHAKKLFDENAKTISSSLPRRRDGLKDLLELLHFAVFRHF